MAQILIVDDSPTLRASAQFTLESEGHAVIQAENGATALSTLDGLSEDEAGDLKMIITDINMPEMDGIEVIMGLQEGLPDLPVVAMSGGGMVDKSSLLEDADILGAVHTLAKPFEIDELIERVEALLPDPE